MNHPENACTGKKYYKNPTTGRIVETKGQKARWTLEARLERERLEIARDVNKGFSYDNPSVII